MCKTEIEYARAEIGWIFGWKHVHSSLNCPPFSFSAVSLLYFPPTLLLFDRHNLFVPPGNYSCMPTNAEGTSAIVHVINGKWTRVCDSGLLLASLFSLSVNPFFRLIFMELGVVIAFIIPFFPLCFVRCVSVCVRCWWSSQNGTLWIIFSWISFFSFYHSGTRWCVCMFH